VGGSAFVVADDIADTLKSILKWNANLQKRRAAEGFGQSV
jgi:hypothetical protein